MESAWLRSLYDQGQWFNTREGSVRLDRPILQFTFIYRRTKAVTDYRRMSGNGLFIRVLSSFLLHCFVLSTSNIHMCLEAVHVFSHKQRIHSNLLIWRNPFK